MGTLAGIDLGTTYSACAVLNKAGKPEVIPTFSGDRITPSCVAFDSSKSSCVGQEAKNRLSDDPEHVVQFVKRKMNEPDYKYEMFGRDYSPIEISAMILKKLKDECTQEGEIYDAVITVPAAFDEVQRKSTMDAGKIAGLNVLGIVNEPTAAAIYYSSLAEVRGNVLVYDLGGGTFDVTIIRMSGNNVEVKTSKGDVHLGGVDFDQAIVKIADDVFLEKTGSHLLPPAFFNSWDTKILSDEERCFFYRLMKKAEQTKKSLSTRPEATLSFVGPNGRNFSEKISRKDFEKAISSFVTTTEMLMENALEDAHMSKSDINKVLLVGGSTRVPAVLSCIERFFGFPPEKAVNVDEAVALGAAIYAGKCKMETRGRTSVPANIRAEIQKISIIDVCNHYFGVDCLDATEKKLENSVILEKNKPLPHEVQKTYFTARDNQEAISFRVTEGEEYTGDLSLVKIIGEIEIPVRGKYPAGTPVEISFSYDKNQRLHILVISPDGRSFETDILYSANGTLSQSEINEKQQEISDIEIV
ncbi:MAG: Hsp70 family protein [Treponema sp.]